MESKIRCGWCLSSELYKEYHDKEWGVPVYDDATLFEFLILETFQAGLSWITILNKRENFRKAFDNFDYKKIANYSEEKVQELLLDAGIIRNKLKVRSAVSNAIAFMTDVLQTVKFDTGLIVGVGLMEMLNVEGVPAQETPLFEKTGVTVIVAVTAVFPVFFAMKAGMLPLPLLPKPIDELLFIQL